MSQETSSKLPITQAKLAALDPSRLFGTPTFERMLELFEGQGELHAGSLWGASQALVLAGLTRRAQGPWLICTSTESEAELFIEDLSVFGVDALLLPARESYTSSAGKADARMHADPETIRRRLQAAQVLAGPPERRPRLIVASLLSLLQPIPSAKEIEADFIHLQINQKLDAMGLLERLVAAGYGRQPLAERPGEVSLRGDILDVFSFAAELPLRIELFDDTIESLRCFEPESQRSIESLSSIELCIASDVGGVQNGRGVQAAQLLSPTTTLINIEPLRLGEQKDGLRIQSSAHARSLIEFARNTKHWRQLSLQSLPADTLNFDTRSVMSLAIGIRAAPPELHKEVQAGQRVVVLCQNAAERDRFRETLAQSIGKEHGVHCALGPLSRGFRLPDLDLLMVNHRELVGLVGVGRSKTPTRKVNLRALESFFELKLGDLVVHAVHGVARFVGLERMSRSGGEEDHLKLMFADEVTLFVPASRIDLVQRYIGSGSASPKLDKIGSSAFKRRKEKVERALVDLAAELLEVQARRQLRLRKPWGFDAQLETEFLESFPYVDTPDQAESDKEMRKEIRSKRPMDRLLCGDVGFGKTEVAMRQAFRVVLGGGQVAVLVPTTVLAQQHFMSFNERMSDFPIEIEVLSRYVTGKKRREVIERVAKGQVDILVGTHRMLSKDVSFPKLGLVIIDEEQRFGVKHKEHFKQFRSEVDLLTLTATPIPRTLHMSLSGLRDISALTHPPQGRQEIETNLISSTDTDRIRHALLREKNRGGQVFFLHNRVHSIERRARELMALVPECTYAIGHGQMSGKQLEEVMDLFVTGGVDVLVSTTIVENGIDVPSAGTILMDDADHFGLSELHQLRGRVGRGVHKSYCYLLIDQSKPLKSAAKERLKALEELTKLGSGFQISMKDLEIRGAGNILGPQQSGHIAAVGYDMYCRLLHATVEGLRNIEDDEEARRALFREVPERVTAELERSAVELELGLVAFLPEDWIPAPNERLELLRRLNTIESPSDAQETQAMLRDRYGRIPPEAETLVMQFELCALLSMQGISRLAWRQEAYLLEYSDRLILERMFAGQNVELRPMGAGRAHLVLPNTERDPQRAAAWIRGHLLRAAGLSMIAGETPDQ